MLVIGCIAACYFYYAANTVYRVGNHLKFRTLFLFFLWPTLLFSEAVFYWMARKRIVYPRNAWLHVGCMAFCFVVFPLLQAALILYIRRVVMRSDSARVISVVTTISATIYWTSIIIGHVFFGMVVKKSWAKTEVPPHNTDNVNLLDDVLN